MKTHHKLHLQGGADVCPIHNALNPPLMIDVCVQELSYFSLKCSGLKYTCVKYVGDTGIPTFCRYTGPTNTTMTRWWMHCRSMSVVLCSTYRAYQSSVQKFWTNHVFHDSWQTSEVSDKWQHFPRTVICFGRFVKPNQMPSPKGSSGLIRQRFKVCTGMLNSVTTRTGLGVHRSLIPGSVSI